MAQGAEMSAVREVLPACQWVLQQARHVTINHDKIPSYTAFVVGGRRPVTLDPGLHHVTDDREETAAYILALDSINFGSGYFDSRLEYETIAGGLKKAFEQGKLNRPEQWITAKPEDFSRLLSVPMNELMALFAQHLQESGKKIIEEYQGSVLNLLEQSGYSALKLADIAAGWDSFHDAPPYKGQQIPLLKRAQILAADMQLALGGFTDMDKLTIFADNMVPHVLRCDGVIGYDAELAANIDQGVYLPAGSDEEIEIRAAAICAVELMKQAAHNEGHAVTSVNLDHMLWHRGYEPELYKKPRHRTLTTAY
jgi:uncharacterized ubiquitin-like protein YukD